MPSNKSRRRRGTGNLLQDLLSSVVRLKKCDKQLIATNPVKSELNIKLQFIHCFICGVKHQRRSLSEVKVEILREIILKESFHESISTTSICPLCSTTLDKLIDLRTKADEISTCIRTVIKLCHDLSDLEVEDIEMQDASSETIDNVDNDDDSSGEESDDIEIQNSTAEAIYNVTLTDEDSSEGLSNEKCEDEDYVDSEDEMMVPDFDDDVSIKSESSTLESRTCTGSNFQTELISCGATEEETATLQCITCSDKFDDLATLEKHKARHKKCQVCERDVSQSSKFSVHLQTRYHQLAALARRVGSDGKVSFVCDQCPKVGPFPNYQKLVDHRKKYHPGRNDVSDGTTPVKSCLPCDQVFYSVKAYKFHLASTRHADRIGEKEALPLDFSCNQCDKKFAAYFQLREHLSNFHGQDVVCEICGIWFRNLARLRSHQKTHVNPPKLRQRYIPPEDKLYPCEFCDKRFTRSRTRNMHTNTVHLGKRYNCDLCPDTFARPVSLRRHKKRVHGLGNGEPLQKISQSLKCDICSKGISKKMGIVRHIELVHFHDKSKCPYGCPDLEFETEHEWAQHLEGCISDKITLASQSPCLFCDAVFRNQLLRLSHHHKTHVTFPCEICSKSFSKQTVLDSHKLSHADCKPHLCSKCGKGFRQALNLSLHSTMVCGDDDEARKKMQEKRRAQKKSYLDKKKDFKCDECSRVFITSKRLELHKEKVHGGEDDDGGNRKSEDSDSDS